MWKRSNYLFKIIMFANIMNSLKTRFILPNCIIITYFNQNRREYFGVCRSWVGSNNSDGSGNKSSISTSNRSINCISNNRIFCAKRLYSAKIDVNDHCWILRKQPTNTPVWWAPNPQNISNGWLCTSRTTRNAWH